MTQAIPIHNGVVHTEGIKAIEVGGSDVSVFLAKALSSDLRMNFLRQNQLLLVRE